MKVGVIGLGAMGEPMARNFHRHDMLYAFWNRTAGRAAALAEMTGRSMSASPTALAAACDLIVTCVSRDADVLDVVGQLRVGIRPDSVVVDTSTVGRETVLRAAAMVAEAGAHFLDCPVSGGTEGARKGTLAMMVGGEARILERVRPALSAIAGNIVHIGPCGSGQACKAVNQHMIAGIYDAVAEAMAFGESMGLDMEQVIAALSSGAAANWVLSNRARTMLARSFPLGFKVTLHHKDLEICRDMARRTDNSELPVVERVLAQFEDLIRQGCGDEDVSALFRLKVHRHGD